MVGRQGFRDALAPVCEEIARTRGTPAGERTSRAASVNNGGVGGWQCLGRSGSATRNLAEILLARRAAGLLDPTVGMPRTMGARSRCTPGSSVPVAHYSLVLQFLRRRQRPSEGRRGQFHSALMRRWPRSSPGRSPRRTSACSMINRPRISGALQVASRMTPELKFAVTTRISESG